MENEEEGDYKATKSKITWANLYCILLLYMLKKKPGPVYRIKKIKIILF
jgi:hypothetical protein